MGFNPIWLVSLKRGEFGHRDTHSWRMSCKEKGGNQGDASIFQGTPKVSSKQPEGMRGA